MRKVFGMEEEEGGREGRRREGGNDEAEEGEGGMEGRREGGRKG